MDESRDQLTTAVAQDLSAFRPAVTPPFQNLLRRRRRHRAATGIAAAAVVAVAGTAVIGIMHQRGPAVMTAQTTEADRAEALLAPFAYVDRAGLEWGLLASDPESGCLWIESTRHRSVPVRLSGDYQREGTALLHRGRAIAQVGDPVVLRSSSYDADGVPGCPAPGRAAVGMLTGPASPPEGTIGPDHEVKDAPWEPALDHDAADLQVPVFVVDTSCSDSGRAHDRIAPQIQVSATSITVTMRVTEGHSINVPVRACLNLTPTPYLLELPEPLGERELLDGGPEPPTPPSLDR